jgi:hypothetical protein
MGEIRGRARPIGGPMRRGCRRIKIGAALVLASLATIVTGAAGWDLSRTWNEDDRQRQVTVRGGGIEFRQTPQGSLSYWSSDGRVLIPVPEPKPRFIWWFRPLREVYTTGFAAPVWPIGLAGLALAALGRRAGRARPGVCRECGYDVRGLAGPECPECGATLSPCASSTSRRA